MYQSCRFLSVYLVLTVVNSVTQPAHLLTGYGPRAVITMAVSGTDEKWTIEKLNGVNWPTWKFQMKHLLLARELWGMVDGTETLVSEEVTEDVFYTGTGNWYIAVVPGDVL